MTATPHVFPAYLSPIVQVLDRSSPYVTDLKLFGEIKNRESQGCPLPIKKTALFLLSICFQFAFNRADSKRDSETRREQFYA